MAVLAGTVGAGALVLRNEPPPVTADSTGGGPSGAGSLVTAIRVDQHDVFDRIVIDFDGEVAAPDPDGPYVRLPDTPECRGPADLDAKSVAYWGLRSAAAPTGDGLVADLSGRRIPGGPYAREVIPLCVAEGHIWLAIVVDDLQAQPPGTRLEDVAASLDRTGSTGTGVCELADQVLIDVFTWPQADDTPPSDEICPPPPA